MRGRKYDEEPSGDAAIFEYAIVNFADSAATTRSPASARLMPAAGRHAVDGHDDRLGRARQARDRAVQIRRQLLDQDADAVRVVVEVLDVAARAKRLARARDDDAAHGAVLVGLERGVEEIAPSARFSAL